MKFISDNQRKACFANMNRFSGDSRNKAIRAFYAGQERKKIDDLREKGDPKYTSGKPIEYIKDNDTGFDNAVITDASSKSNQFFSPDAFFINVSEALHGGDMDSILSTLKNITPQQKTALMVYLGDDDTEESKFIRRNMFAQKKYYHGTAGFRGRVIMADGLVPPSQIDMPHSRDEMRGPEFDEYVFLTTDKDLAKTHAERRARHWGDTEYGPIVYEVDLDEAEVIPDTFDPIMYPDSFKYKGTISREKIKKSKFSVNKKSLKCSKCGGSLDPIDAFPGNRCIGCYEKDFDSGGSEEKKVQDFKSAWNGGIVSKKTKFSKDPKKFLIPDNIENIHDYVPIKVSVDKFKEYWKRNPDNYYEKDSVALENQYKGVSEEVKKSKEIYMPEVYAKPGPVPELDTIDIADGRHRSAAIIEHGLKDMKIIVPDFQKKWFEDKMGAK